jgi:peptidoglycan hydrolase-like protein with peptidoglycan-binding domain
MTTLRRGSRGSAVKALQRKLGVTADGVFGPITASAVNRAKRRHKLPADGVAGPRLLGILKVQTKAPAKKPTTARGRTIAWLQARNGLTEQPAGSNRDARRDGITAAQKLVAGGGSWLVGQAWCGVWAAAAALHAGVKIPTPARWASVAAIEDDARAGRNGFRRWTSSTKGVLRGDLAVLYGRGVHVETVAEVHAGYVVTYGGNTSSGTSGSQSNGGGAFRRVRSLSVVHGFALVDYPG